MGAGMTEPADADDVIRTQAFTTDGPVEIDVQLTTGSLTVELTEADGEDGVQVDVRHDPAAGQPWTHGLASALSWVNEQFGDQFDADLVGTGTAAVEQTRIEMQGNRLLVQAPKALPLRHLPLAVTVRVPAGSELNVRAASARVDVRGAVNSVNVTSTAGDITLDRVDGPVHVRTGGGDVSVGLVGGTASVVTGTGSVRVGSLEGELSVRSGSGNIALTDAATGTANLRSGSGEVRVGLHAGVLAEIHLSSATGKATSELEVHDDPPESESAPMRVKASSGSGNVSVTSSRE